METEFIVECGNCGHIDSSDEFMCYDYEGCWLECPECGAIEI